MSLLVRGATVVTSLDPPAVERADLLVEGDRIALVGAATEAHAPALDATGCLLLPGNVNAHMHAYAALTRGMPYHLPPPTNFLEILQRVWWRVDRALDLPSIRASALVAAREALLAGTTTLVDHHASPNAIDGSLDLLAAACAEVGIRAVLAYEVTDRDGPERTTAGLEENRRFLRRVADGGYPLARGMVGAHAAFTLSDETLTACAGLARDSGAGVHIHVAEDAIDAGAARRLTDAGALRPGSLAAHAVHVSRDEIDLLRDRGITVAHNPRSNMNNGVGRAPVGLLGEQVALGTDGIGSDMWAEGRTGYLRCREADLETAPDWALRRLAAGARLVGECFGEPLLGRIAAGAPADVVVLDYAPPTPLAAAGLAGHWIFGMATAYVRDVIVAGEVVVRDRRLTRVDETELQEEALAQARGLWARVEDIAPHPFTALPRRAAATGGARWPT
jgi:putative selenium metabolism protein SsnA